jgi:hypothetical protein
MSHLRQMSKKGSLERAVRQLRLALSGPYRGIMYDERSQPIEGEWVNGLRAPDARLLLDIVQQHLTDKAV